MHLKRFTIDDNTISASSDHMRARALWVGGGGIMQDILAKRAPREMGEEMRLGEGRKQSRIRGLRDGGAR